jgi:hypothetical protein
MQGNMKLTTDATASKGSYFSMPAGHGINYYIPPSSGAEFYFELAKSDNYFVWARIKSPAFNNQGFHLYDGRGKWTTWLAGVYSDWTWVRVTDAYTKAIAVFPYPAGPNILRMAWFHENTMVDAVFITNDPDFKPAEKSTLTSARTSLQRVPLFEEQPQVMDIYPNPVQDHFMIRYSSPAKQEARITVTSATTLKKKEMIVVLQQGPNDIQVKMENEQKGLYLLSIVTSAGQRQLTKIMVTK